MASTIYGRPRGPMRAAPNSRLVEPRIQAVERENFLARGHDRAVHLVVGVESDLPGAPPDVDVVAHHPGRFDAVLGPVLFLHVAPPLLRDGGPERDRPAGRNRDQVAPRARDHRDDVVATAAGRDPA